MPTKKPTTKRKSQTRKNEKLLCACSTLLDRSTVKSIAAELHGKMLYRDARYWQVVSVRISGHKVYGECQEMEEHGYMFSPVVSQDTLF